MAEDKKSGTEIADENQFSKRVSEFLLVRSPKCFVALLVAATSLLLKSDPPQEKWVPLREADEFSRIRMTFSSELGQIGIAVVSQCLGYALSATLAGEWLSDPIEVTSPNELYPATVLEYYYDSTKSRRDDLHNDEAEELARKYIDEGTPTRKTDRAGKGTKGTRLVRGLGFEPESIEVAA